MATALANAYAKRCATVDCTNIPEYVVRVTQFKLQSFCRRCVEEGRLQKRSKLSTFLFTTLRDTGILRKAWKEPLDTDAAFIKFVHFTQGFIPPVWGNRINIYLDDLNSALTLSKLEDIYGNAGVEDAVTLMSCDMALLAGTSELRASNFVVPVGIGNVPIETTFEQLIWACTRPFGCDSLNFKDFIMPILRGHIPHPWLPGQQVGIKKRALINSKINYIRDPSMFYWIGDGKVYPAHVGNAILARVYAAVVLRTPRLAALIASIKTSRPIYNPISTMFNPRPMTYAIVSPHAYFPFTSKELSFNISSIVYELLTRDGDYTWNDPELGGPKI